MVAVFIEVFAAFGLTISEEQDGDHAHIDSACVGNADSQIVFNTPGQQYHRTTSFTCLGDAVTETPNNLSDEIDRRIRAGWMRFRRYTRELHDRPKTSLLDPKARMVKSEV